VNMQTGEIFGYEALTRGPRQTALESPATLFSVADEVNLTFELDRACFRSCLRGAVGLEPIHRLFVNLLPLSFYDASFIETEVSHLLDAAALTPANVVFEITERLAIENFNTFRKALGRYTAMGFGVAIDDVGTRHSNLETVMALRPHFIKVSDVLSRGVARSTVKREMLQSLGKIAEAIDAVVVAEGIETPDDLVVLHDLSIRYGQGFFLARPGPPFPRVRAAVRRAIVTLTTSERAPIAAPPADYDDDGDSCESPDSSDRIRQAVTAMARGSGQFPLSADAEASPTPPAREPDVDHAPLPEPRDSFEEPTRPHIIKQSWSPLDISDFSDQAGDEIPLIDSLRGAPLDGEEDEPDDGDFDDEPTGDGKTPTSSPD
jgi:EAL domain-containing protein (putative c-di-GMP-specific phosphodiesterase class I)